MSWSPATILTLPTAVKRSRTWTVLTKFKSKLADGAQQSMLTNTGAIFSRVIKNSWLYRWLTKEPEPEVIVIDLRDTWTVRPFITLLDWLVSLFHSGYQGSQLQSAATTFSSQFQAQPVKLVSELVIVFVGTVLMFLALQGSLSTSTIVGGGALLLIGFMGLFVDLSLEEFQNTRIMRFLISILEPPEPPES